MEQWAEDGGWTGGARRPTRRAPRLGPDERIAPHLTRGGRFSRVDPLKVPERPTIPRILGVVGWAVLTVESLRRARAVVRARGGEAV
jgi:hypothetical protein